MFSAFEWMVALRYLRARRQEGFISVIAWFSLIGIALGVATLIIVMSVMNGFRQELLTRILGVNGHLSIYGVEHYINDYDNMSAQVSRVNGVVKVTPMIEGQVMASANGQATGALVRGLLPIDLFDRPILADNIRSGDLANFKGTDAVLIGILLARTLHLGLGDRITLISPKGNITVFGTVPRLRSYTICGIFNVGMHEYDSSFIFIPLIAAQKYFKLPNAVNYLDVVITDPDTVRTVAQNIKQSIGARVRILDWQQTNSSFFNAIQVERNVMFLILTLIIVVAALNIISSLTMLVKDKGRDIAILRTMGATRGMIMRIFFLSGASVGVIGTMVGFGLGLTFSENIEAFRQWLQNLTDTELFAPEIYFLSQLPAEVDPTEVGAIVLMGLALSLLATLYPSWRAAQLDPVEALRYE